MLKDPIQDIRVHVKSNEKLNSHYYRLVFDSEFFSKHVRAGQFLNLKLHREDCFLRRPFSVYDVRGTEISILYMIVGRGTQLMANLSSGEALDVLGPLGTGFKFPEKNSVIYLIAGGTGVGSIFLFYRKLLEQGFSQVKLVIGCRSADFVVQELVEAGACFFTEDGSFGAEGLVTKILDEFLLIKESRALYACGPHGMLRAISEKIKGQEVFSQLSLEESMACGLGACLGCVAETKHGRKTVCKYGPIYDLDDVVGYI